MILAALALTLSDPHVTQANIGTTICRPGYSTAQRHTQPPSYYAHQKRILARAAGVSPKGWVLDHRLPLELGGRPDAPNLQLQTVRDAKAKDRVEGRLHRLTCRGLIDLRAAQAEIWRWMP